MDAAAGITNHYSRGDLFARLRASLIEDGADPEHPTAEALAPYDQFHGRGLEATIELAKLLQPVAADHLLDIGSGIGGPARFFAARFGCRVTGIDLTEGFCEVARHLTRLLQLDDRVRFEVGDALAMPFADAAFDGAYSMNVSMNIADKGALYREIHRVLKPGASLALSELAQGAGGDVEYPTPWASSARASFLSTPEETLRGVKEAGFTVVRSRDTADEARAANARARALVERGQKPPQRAVMLIHGDLASQATANMSRALVENRIVPIEVLARKEP